ncbi:MAG: hypothetical protein N2653_04660 [Burkholderiales bacterium]|nr:hypothetical protein [Burkholderiales bacterium]
MSEANAEVPMTTRETNPLVRRVDELLRSRAEASADVPLLTEVVEPEARRGYDARVDPRALAAELERALLARLAPELDRRLALLRAELESAVRRAVQEAVAAALAARAAAPRGGESR